MEEQTTRTFVISDSDGNNAFIAIIPPKGNTVELDYTEYTKHSAPLFDAGGLTQLITDLTELRDIIAPAPVTDTDSFTKVSGINGDVFVYPDSVSTSKRNVKLTSEGRTEVITALARFVPCENEGTATNEDRELSVATDNEDVVITAYCTSIRSRTVIACLTPEQAQQFAIGILKTVDEVTS